MSASQNKPASSIPTDIVPDNVITDTSGIRNTPATRPPPKGLSTDKSVHKTPRSAAKINRTTPRSAFKKDTTGTRDRIQDINILIRAVSEYLNILVTSDNALKQEPWYPLWESWIEEGILQNPTLHMVSVIVDFPVKEMKSIKSVGEHILHQIPPLSRLIYIPNRTRPNDPWLYLNEPLQDDTAPNLHSKIFNPSKAKSKASDDASNNDKTTNDPVTKLANTSIIDPPPSLNPTQKDLPSSLNLTDVSLPSPTASVTTPIPDTASKSNAPAVTPTKTVVKSSDATPVITNPYSMLTMEDSSVNLEDIEMEELEEAPPSTLISKFDDDKMNTSTTTNDIIQDMASLEDVFDKEVDEIGTILVPDQTTERILTAKPTSSSWDLEKLKIDTYFREKEESFKSKYDLLLQQYSISIKELFKNESSKLAATCKDTTTTAIKHIYKSSQGHKDILNNLSSDTINSCTNLCSEFKEDLNLKTSDAINDITMKVEKHEAKATIRRKETWTNLETSMKQNLTQLSKTNSIAIKNNKILTAKLDDARQKINQMDETISLQKSMIDNMTETIQTNDDRLAQLRDLKSAEYSSLVDSVASKMISSAVKKECKSICSKREIYAELEKECQKIEVGTTTRITDMTNHATELIQDTINTCSKECHDEKYTVFQNKCNDIIQVSEQTMQEKVNEITAKVDTVYNQRNPTTPLPTNSPVDQKNQAPTGHSKLNSNITSTLFPNVRLDDNHTHQHTNIPMQGGPDNHIPPYDNANAPYSSDYPYPTNSSFPHTTPSFPQASRPLSDQEYIFNSQKYYVNTNTFYKLRWNCKCQNEVEILTFYKTLQHMASTCGIPLRDLDDVDEFNGVCPLTIHNCTNYDKVYKLMSGAIFYKINDATLWKGYDQGWNLVTSNILQCDGFEVLYDILADVLPKLNKNTPKSHKIQKPTYVDMDHDNIYTYVSAYNAFLEFEGLGSNSRTYTPYEVAVYVADDLEKDPHKRFEKGIAYVRQKLERSPDGVIIPKDITITKIAKTICKYSPEYVVGEYTSETEPVIHALKQAHAPRVDYRTTTTKYKSKRNTSNRDPSIKCSICGQGGHNTDSENGCHYFAKWTLCKQADDKLDESVIKTNTRKYLKHMKRQHTESRQRDKIEKRIRCLQSDENSENNTALIHSLQILHEELLDDSSVYSSSDDDQ